MAFGRAKHIAATFVLAVCVFAVLMLAGCTEAPEAASNAEDVAAIATADETSAAAAGGADERDSAGGYIEYMGQASVKVVTPEGKVIYIDPYAGSDYGDAADLILSTHAHFDHRAFDLVSTRNSDCVTITERESIASDGYNVVDLGFARVIPVQAGFNRMHDVGSCVGYVIELTDGMRIYVTGDTSTTDDMRDGTLAAMGIDYAFWCSDGVYNMDTTEASVAAEMVGAKVNIPYHNSTSNQGDMLDADLARSFTGPNALVLTPGEKIEL